MVFYNCNSLTPVNVYWKEPISILENVFQYENETEGNSELLLFILYVPKGTKANYEAADVWKEFTIVEREDTPTAVSDISSADEIIGTEYYDLQGRKVAEPLNGIYIVVKRYKSGKSVSEKEIR